MSGWYSVFNSETMQVGLVESKTSSARVIYYLPGWIIALIVVGCLLGVGIIVGLVIYFKVRKPKAKKSTLIIDP